MDRCEVRICNFYHISICICVGVNAKTPVVFCIARFNMHTCLRWKLIHLAACVDTCHKRISTETNFLKWMQVSRYLIEELAYQLRYV